MARLYYDLTELFFASGQKFKYYGIARTVMEVGYELARMKAEVGFVVFSPAHGHFFEVTPRLGAASPTGVLDPGLPAAATPKRMRLSFPRPNLLRDALYPAVLALTRRVNLRRWSHVPEGAAQPVKLDGEILVALGRPKIMADYLIALDRAGQSPRFYPLLHDMIPLYEFAHPSQSMFSSNFGHDNHIVIGHAEGLLSNSHFTKSEIERFAESGHLPTIPQVTATPLAHELRPTDEPVHKRGPDAPYLLCVGTHLGRKNLECIIAALMELKGRGRPVPHLVMAGAYRKRVEQYVERPEFAPIREQIHTVLNPNQSELRGLYEGALALVIPSRMEGWGLPLGEALWLGTPVLASTAPALREVGRDLALYFDPDAPGELAQHIDRLQSGSDCHAKLKAEVREARAQLRSWADVARDILQAVQKAPTAGVGTKVSAST